MVVERFYDFYTLMFFPSFLSLGDGLLNGGEAGVYLWRTSLTSHRVY